MCAKLTFPSTSFYFCIDDFVKDGFMLFGVDFLSQSSNGSRYANKYSIVAYIHDLVMNSAFVIPPGTSVVYPGDSFGYTCSPNDGIRVIGSIQWFLNGSLLDNQSLKNVTDGLATFDGTIVSGRLEFVNLPLKYRMTQICCRIQYIMGSSEYSETVLLAVQGNFCRIFLYIANFSCFIGTLSAVENLTAMRQDLTVFLNWTAPPTLHMNPERDYCVEVVNFTSSELLERKCEINETHFIYPEPSDSECHGTAFTVTPVNVVGDGENATQWFTLELKFVSHSIQCSNETDN